MIRVVFLFMLLAIPAMAQAGHSWNWVVTNLGWVHRLQDGHVWTGYVVGRNSDGTYTLYRGNEAIAQGSDMSSLRRQAEAAAQ